MRSTLLILFLAAAVIVVWLVKSPDRLTLKAPPKPSEVSEHDWAKQALDRTADVKRQIAQQRKEDQEN